MIEIILIFLIRAYFRIAGLTCHCVMNKRGHILVNLEQIKDEISIKSTQVFGL